MTEQQKEKLRTYIMERRETAMKDSTKQNKCTLAGALAGARHDGVADAYLDVLLELDNIG